MKANVLVSRDGIARLSDFGLSKFFEDVRRLKCRNFYIDFVSQCDRDLVPSSSGSLRWTAPEVLKQGGVVSMRSDIWSFGMLCLEILSGEVPFSGKSEAEVRHQLEQAKHPERPSRMATVNGLNTGMWNLMCQCWGKKPELRPSMNRVKPFLLELRELTFTRKSTRPGTADSAMSTMTVKTYQSSSRQPLLSPTFLDDPIQLSPQQQHQRGFSESNQSVEQILTPRRKGSSWLRSLSIRSSKPSISVLTSPLLSSPSSSSGLSAKPPTVDFPFLPYNDGDNLFSNDHLTSPTTTSPFLESYTQLNPPPAQSVAEISRRSANIMDGIVDFGSLEDLVEILIQTFGE